MCWGCHIFFKDAFRFLWLAVIWMSQLPVGVTWFRTVITVLFKQSLLFRMIKPVGGMQGPIELYIYVRSLFYGEDRATPNTQVHLQLCRSSSMQLGRTLPSPLLSLCWPVPDMLCGRGALSNRQAAGGCMPVRSKRHRRIVAGYSLVCLG